MEDYEPIHLQIIFGLPPEENQTSNRDQALPFLFPYSKLSPIPLTVVSMIPICEYAMNSL